MAVILQVSAGQAVTRDEELNEVYRKTQKYVERFNQMANKEKDHQGTFDGNIFNTVSFIAKKVMLKLLLLLCFLFHFYF